MTELVLVGDVSFCEQLASLFKDRDQAYVVAVDNTGDKDYFHTRGINSRLINADIEQAMFELEIDTGPAKLYCLFESDARNIFLALSARQQNVALEIFSLAHSADAEKKLKAVGVDVVLDAYEIAANSIYKQLKDPTATAAMEATIFAADRLQVKQCTLGSGSDYIGQLAEKISLPADDKMLLLAYQKKNQQQIHFIAADDEYYLKNGDVLVLLGMPRPLQDFLTAHAD